MKKRITILASVLVLTVASGTVAYAAPAFPARSSCGYRYVDKNDNGICDFRELWEDCRDAWEEEQNNASQGSVEQAGPQENAGQAVAPSGNEIQGAGQGTGQGVGQGAGQGTGQGAGQGAGQGTGQGVGQGAGQGTGQGVGQGAGQGTGQGAGQGTGQGAGYGSGGHHSTAHHGGGHGRHR